MSQPAPTTGPFATGWYSFDLGLYRPCNGTYCLSAYDSLPPLADAPLDGSLGWLTPLSAQHDQLMDVYRPGDATWAQLTRRMDAIAEQARQLGLTLPTSFAPFMTNAALQDRIPSCTACEFALPGRIARSVAGDGGYLISFLHDQQDVLVWYLYLTPTGEQRVVVSPYDYDGDDDDPNAPGHVPSGVDELTDQQRAAIIANTFVCAPTFEAFLYRFWLENTIWFALNDGKQLTDAQQRYVAHYG